MLTLVAAHHSEREFARRVASRLRLAIPLPTIHMVKAIDARIAPEFVKALDAADRILLLATSSTTSLRTARRLLRFTSSIGVGADRLLLVAHGLGRRYGLGARELGEMLQREIYWELVPEDAAPAIQEASYCGLAAKLGLSGEMPNGRT